MYSKNLKISFIIIIILSIINCDNDPISSNDYVEGDGYLQYNFLDKTNYKASKIKKIPFSIENVISANKIFRKDIYLDTNIYKTKIEVPGFSDIKDDSTTGIIAYITNTDSMNIRSLLRKKHDKNSDSVYVGTYNLFFISDTPIASNWVPQPIKLYKKTGEIDGFYLHIENLDQYRLSFADASLRLDNNEPLENIDLDKYSAVYSNSILNDSNMVDKYDFIQTDKYSYFINNEFKTNTITQMPINGIKNPQYYAISLKSNYSDYKINNYTFIIEK